MLCDAFNWQRCNCGVGKHGRGIIVVDKESSFIVIMSFSLCMCACVGERVRGFRNVVVYGSIIRKMGEGLGGITRFDERNSIFSFDPLVFKTAEAVRIMR